MGSDISIRSASSISPSSSEPASRLFEQGVLIKQRMVPEPTSLQSPDPNLGNSGNRSGSNTLKHKVSEVPFESCIPICGGSGRPSPSVELPIGVHISNAFDCEVPIEAREIFGISDSDHSFLAQEALVYDSSTAQSGGPTTSSIIIRSSSPRSVPPSSPREALSDGLDIERIRFLEQGCSQEVVSTLLQARKYSTNVTYDRIWDKFMSMAQQNGWDPLCPEVPQVLEFLQAGLSRGLNSSTLKVQVSALSSKTDVKWANHPLLIQFIKACVKIRPPRRPTFPAWVLSIVLKTGVSFPSS